MSDTVNKIINQLSALTLDELGQLKANVDSIYRDKLAASGDRPTPEEVEAYERGGAIAAIKTIRFRVGGLVLAKSLHDQWVTEGKYRR